MTAVSYLGIMSICVIAALVASLVYHGVTSYRKLVKRIRIAEIQIIEKLETRLHGDMLDLVVDIVAPELESALRAE